MKGDLHTGFELPIQKLAVVTEEELFHKKSEKIFKNDKSYQMRNGLKITQN